MLAPHHPLPAKILEYRMVAKLLSTYVETLPHLIHTNSGRIHTTFNVIGTATGRISSTDPNLQNIPIKEERGKKIRSAFIPDEQYDFISADYSQIELVVFSHLSQDEQLLAAFREGSDVHALTASKIFNRDIASITENERRTAKVINFGVMYGMSAFRLSRELNISRNDATAFIEHYFDTYAGVRQYINATIEQARATGFVHTILGRKRSVADINNKNSLVRQAAERIAVNTPIQGSAADIIKIAMRNIHHIFTDKQLKSRLLLQVHDELVVEAAYTEREQVIDILKQEMTGAYQLSIPLRVHISSGSDWGALK